MSNKNRVVWFGECGRLGKFRVVLSEEEGAVVEVSGTDATGNQSWWPEGDETVIVLVCGKAIAHLAGALADAEMRLRVAAGCVAS